MATRPGIDQGKSAFIRDLLRRNPEANPKVVNEAWREAGNEGSISNSLVSKTRSDLGLSSRRRAGEPAAARRGAKPGRKPGRPAAAEAMPRPEGGPAAEMAPTAAREEGGNGAGEQEQILDSLEGSIDELIFKLKNLGGRPEIEEALRRARRLLYGHQR
ncbi:MAG TPA: hypothetical protein VF590_22135 [Isosphaeraceae bacterium]|jgi:hypothetical protein